MPVEPECVPQQISVLVLGSAASGKTQIISQFVDCDFRETHRPTKRSHTHYKSVSLNERVYQLAIIDLPYVYRSSKLQYQDWETFINKDKDLHNTANAFIFVFDLTCEESFGHIRKLREQMHDILHISSNSNGNAANNNSTVSNGFPASGGSSSSLPLIVMGNKYDLLFANRGHLSRRYAEIVNIIRKQWKWHYVECSAKYNWQIQHAFKTLTKLIDAKFFANRPGGAERLIPGVLRRNRCVLC